MATYYVNVVDVASGYTPPQMTPVSDATPLPVANTPGTSGGATPYRNLDLGVTGQVVKASAGQVYGWVLCNNAGASRFVKLYNKATAPTEADTPVMTIELPALSTGQYAIPVGIAFAAGISVRATTGVADNDVGAPTANDVVVNLLYA